MPDRFIWLLTSALCLALSACACARTASESTITPTESPIRAIATCDALDTAWATGNWPIVLNVLQQLETIQMQCGSDSLDAKLYAAHINYAAALEANDQEAAAIEHYRAAFAVNSRGREAIEALARLSALPTLPPPPCQPNEVAPYRATTGDFVTVADRGFKLNGQSFYLLGVNYYPRHTPWEQFLTNSDLQEVKQEMSLIASAGFNTARIALWYDPLFTCAPEKAIPSAAGLAKLDAIITLAREHGLRLIVTLNDLPDLYFRPLYTDYARYDAQTAFIVNRYQDEPAIIAWDLRNEADLDYEANGTPPQFKPETVSAWLTHIAGVVRRSDAHHLITVGWWGDATSADEMVDFLSFHHWADAATLTQRIKTLRAESTKPIVLEEVGYPSWDHESEAQQARSLQEAINAAKSGGTAGWLIWTAFDFVPPPGQVPNQERSFGLWRVDMTPKPALTVLPLHAQP